MKAFELGNPIDERLTGWHIAQPDYPWWVSEVLMWLGMVNAIRSDIGEHASAWQADLDYQLRESPPSFLYAFYGRWLEAQEADRNLRRAR